MCEIYSKLPIKTPDLAEIRLLILFVSIQVLLEVNVSTFIK